LFFSEEATCYQRWDEVLGRNPGNEKMAKAIATDSGFNGMHTSHRQQFFSGAKDVEELYLI